VSERYGNKQDLAAKVDWEGGLTEAIEYGIRTGDLPAGTPQAIIDAWKRLEDSYVDVGRVNEWLHS
jgi:hypothetical protein